MTEEQRRICQLLDDPEAVALLPVTDLDHALSEMKGLRRTREVLAALHQRQRDYYERRKQQNETKEQ